MTLMTLLHGNKLHIALFTDFASGQKQRVRELKESRLLKSGHVMCADAYAGQPEADIEDLIGREAYVTLVAASYGLAPQYQLPAQKPGSAPSRVVKEVEAHFSSLRATVDPFDHYRPAVYLLQQGIDYSLAGVDYALNCFEHLFRDLNEIL